MLQGKPGTPSTSMEPSLGAEDLKHGFTTVLSYSGDKENGPSTSNGLCGDQFGMLCNRRDGDLFLSE